MKLFVYGLLVLSLFQSCSENNVSQDKNLKKYFDENKVEGCFALMDNGTGKFTVHNLVVTATAATCLPPHLKLSIH